MYLILFGLKTFKTSVEKPRKLGSSFQKFGAKNDIDKCLQNDI